MNCVQFYENDRKILNLQQSFDQMDNEEKNNHLMCLLKQSSKAG